MEPFAKKHHKSKDLFKRIHGTKKACIAGLNSLEITSPYTLAKMEGAEIVWAPAGSIANFKVYDNAAGTISGVPNLMLNQFGFSVNVNEGFHIQKSQYDADIIQGMKVELEITLPSGFSGEIGLNIELNEVR